MYSFIILLRHKRLFQLNIDSDVEDDPDNQLPLLPTEKHTSDGTIRRNLARDFKEV